MNNNHVNITLINYFVDLNTLKYAVVHIDSYSYLFISK